MAEKNSREIMVAPSGGMLKDLVIRLKLILRLMGDRRVNVFLKLLPVAALAYFISPIDLAPGITLPIVGALDDAAILGLGAYLFIELSPADVVHEHMKNLTSNLDPTPEGEIVEGESTDLPDSK